MHDLSNYHVRIAGINVYQNVLSHGKLLKRDGYAFSKAVGNLIWRSLNAKATYKYFSWDQMGEIGGDGIATGVLGDVLQGQFDGAIASGSDLGFWKNEMNLLRTTGLCFVTKKELVSIIQQFSDTFLITDFLFFLVIFTTVLAFLAYLLKMSYLEVGLDMIRAAVNASMIHIKPDSNMSESIFISLIFSFIILSSWLQSQFSAILVAPMSKYKNMSSATDLVKNGYKVYGDVYFAQFYYNTSLDGNIISIENSTKCLELMKNDDSAACIGYCDWTGIEIHESDKYHIFQDEFFSRYDVFPFPNDSPLLDRANRIYRRLFECGFITYANNMEKLLFQSDHTTEFKSVPLYQLRYAFYSLIISCAIAFFIFSIELCSDQKTILQAKCVLNLLRSKINLLRLK